MPKKADKRRRQRRQQHQVAQQTRRLEHRRVIEEQVASTSQALKRLVEAVKDETLPAPEAAAMVADSMEADDLLRGVLRSANVVTDIAEEVVEESGRERAVAVASSMEELLERDLSLAWLAVSLAEEADDLDMAARMAERCANEKEPAVTLPDEDAAVMRTELARIYSRQGRLGDAIESLERWCAEWPEEDALQEVRASLMARTRALESGDPEVRQILAGHVVDEGQHAAAIAACARFADRSLLYRLRDAVEAFIDADPKLKGRRERHLAVFFRELKEAAGLGPLDEPDADVANLAAEQFWLDSEREGDEPVLGRFAADPATPAQLADAARAWLDHVRYGLWLGDWDIATDPERGVWLTDIVTRCRVFASIPPEQLAGVARWTVLAGAVAPVDGVWRSGKSWLALDPTLADEAAESTLHMTERLLDILARERGIKGPRAKSRRGPIRPHAVLSDLLDPMQGAEADITGKVLGSSLPNLVAMAEEERRRTPTLQNTDGEPLELFNATFPVDDVSTLRSSLRRDPDFEASDGDDAAGPDREPVTWMGRLMTADESARALAQFEAESRRMGWDPVEPGGPQRWVRGTLHFEAGHVRVEVNSRARLDAISSKLRGLGAGEPTVTRVDPSMDLPWPGGRPIAGGSLGPEHDAAWLDQWVTEKVPALDGATPLDAARDPRRIVLLEKLLRQFEHDADLVAFAGGTPMDFEAVRERLGMRDGVLGFGDDEYE